MERTLSNRRRYLTQDELEKLIKASRKGRYGRRDATLLLLMARDVSSGSPPWTELEQFPI
jgi:hypothetical protein